MSITTWWWIAFFLLVAAEMVTGTFYLLMVALGIGAAALLSYGDTSLTQQVGAAAAISAGAVALWHVYRAKRLGTGTGTGTGTDMSMDIGQTVMVASWEPDHTAKVLYRGAAWTAIAAQGHTNLQPGLHHIAAIDGSRLRIKPAEPDSAATPS